MIESAAPLWDHDFARRSPMFAMLRATAEKLPEIGWPNVEVLNHVALETGRRIVNARGQRIWFVPAECGDGQGFETLTFTQGHVRVRPIDWHDLLNALVWMVFPTAKASINLRHQQEIDAQVDNTRSAVRDALTHFDEDGMIVLSADTSLSALLQGFAWKDLFWMQRDEVARSMRFVPFGHALYDKLRKPFIGVTAKALVFEVEADVLALDREAMRAHIDRLLGLHILDAMRMTSPKVLQPVPLLGVPGWWPQNEDPAFYDDADYFRPGRRG